MLSPESTSVRVTVPRRLRLTPGPAMGAPLVRSAGQSTLSHGCPMALGPLLHAKAARPNVSEWSWSAVRTYREHPALAPEPTISTLPKGVDAVDTVAGPVGALVTGVAQEGELPCALTRELS